MSVDVKKIGGIGRGDYVWFEPESLEIVLDKDSPLADERTGLEPTREFINNIKFYGILEPIIGRFNPSTGRTEVVDGRQRVKAARIAKQEQIKAGEVTIRVPVILKKEEDSRVMGIMISSNEQRRADSPMTKARKAQRMQNMGRSIEEISLAFGVTEQSIKNWLSLLDPKPKKPVQQDKPKPPSKKQIRDRFKVSQKETLQPKSYEKGFADALAWVLGKGKNNGQK